MLLVHDWGKVRRQTVDVWEVLGLPIAASIAQTSLFVGIMTTAVRWPAQSASQRNKICVEVRGRWWPWHTFSADAKTLQPVFWSLQQTQRLMHVPLMRPWKSFKNARMFPEFACSKSTCLKRVLLHDGILEKRWQPVQFFDNFFSCSER